MINASLIIYAYARIERRKKFIFLPLSTTHVYERIFIKTERKIIVLAKKRKLSA